MSRTLYSPPNAAVVCLFDLLIEVMEQSPVDGCVPVHHLSDRALLRFQTHPIPELIQSALELVSVQHHLPIVLILVRSCRNTDLTPGGHVVQGMVRICKSQSKVGPVREVKDTAKVL